MVINELNYWVCKILIKLIQFKFTPRKLKLIIAKLAFKLAMFGIQLEFVKLEYLQRNKLF